MNVAMFEAKAAEMCGCYECVGGLYRPSDGLPKCTRNEILDRLMRFEPPIAHLPLDIRRAAMGLPPHDIDLRAVLATVKAGAPVAYAFPEGVTMAHVDGFFPAAPGGPVMTLPLDALNAGTFAAPTGTFSAPTPTDKGDVFKFADVLDAVQELERASYSERERKQLERHARAFHPSMDFALEPHESPTVTIEGEELPSITVKPHRFELVALKLTRRKLEIRPSWFQAPLVVEGEQPEPSSWLRCTAVVRVVDRDNPRLLRELNAVRECVVDPEREIGAQAAALAWSLLEQLVLHELKETFFVDGRHFRDPEPEHG